MNLRIKIASLVALLIGNFFIRAQTPLLDSLKLSFKNAGHDTTRCVILNALIEAEPDENIWSKYNEELLRLAEKNAAKAPSSQLKIFYKRHLAGAMNNVGYLQYQKGNSLEALKGWKTCLAIQEEIHDLFGMATTVNNMGATYMNQGNMPKALDHYHLGLKYYEAAGNKRGAAYSLTNIGLIYSKLGEVKKALEYYDQSLKIREAIQDKEGIAYSLNNIGYIYYEQGDFEKALACHQKSLKLREGSQDKRGIAESLNNMGLVYENQDRKEMALQYYRQSLKVREEIQDKRGIANTLNLIASLLVEKGQLGEATLLAKKSLQTARELGFPENIQMAAKTLKEIHHRQGNYKEAFSMQELEMLMKDSATNEETKRISIKKQFQYEYERRATADSVKNAAEQNIKNAQLLAQKAELQQERTQRYALYGGLLAVITLAAFVFNRFKITQKQKAIIEKQKVLVDQAYQSLHQKNKEVTDSIMYARRIQQALLTTDLYITRALNKLNKNENVQNHLSQ